ncbi:MAG: hypothetical protein ACRCXY_11370 [Fusobacteriaceae bacterium]
MATVYKLYMFDKIATLITSLTPAKTITGTAENMFKAVTGELLPAIAEMNYGSTEYNLQTGLQALRATKPEDILIFVSSNVKTKLSAAVLSQLFHKELADLESIYSKANVISLGNKIIVPEDESQRITTGAPYMDDTTVIVMSKDTIKYLMVNSAFETQM